MKSLLLALALTLTAAARASATFSIIAFDPATGDLGVGVQSHAFTAGAAVPYAIPGVGGWSCARKRRRGRPMGPVRLALVLR